MDPLNVGDIDHRKKRRNRTTHSCINCHTTKRKCDRKRPCQRCTQLGLTGLCVYEVDDPTLPDDPNVDESTRLRKRIAELEGVIRELKNKPHPRWISQASDSSSSFHTRSQLNASKKRKIDDPHDIVDLSMLPDGVTPGPSSVAVKLEHGMDGDGVFNPDAYDARYTLPDSFGLSPDYSGSSPDHSNPSDSPRMYRHTHAHHRAPVRPSDCECLSNAVAFHSVTGLEEHLRGAMSVLANLRHSPTAGSAANDAAQCALYAEIARLQDLIAVSTRPTTPMVFNAQPSPQHRVPLSVKVPMTFQDSVPHGIPQGFNLRAPPSGSAQRSHVLSPTSDKQQMPPPTPSTASGVLTPPLSSHSGAQAYPWDAHTIHAHQQQHHIATSASPSPVPVAVQTVIAASGPPSPTLSSASSSFGSAHSHGIVAPSVPAVPALPLAMAAMDAGYTPYFAPQHQHQSSHARYSAAAAATPAQEYESYALAETYAHHQHHHAAFAMPLRANAY